MVNALLGCIVWLAPILIVAWAEHHKNTSVRRGYSSSTSSKATMPHSGMTPAELAKFMSRGRRKNPEDEEPIFMRLDRIVDERAILKDRHAAGHAAAQALQATIDKHETALKKWVHRAEFQKNEAPPVNKAALASPHHLFPRDWTEIHPEESSGVRVLRREATQDLKKAVGENNRDLRMGRPPRHPEEVIVELGRRSRGLWPEGTKRKSMYDDSTALDLSQSAVSPSRASLLSAGSSAA